LAFKRPQNHDNQSAVWAEVPAVTAYPRALENLKKKRFKFLGATNPAMQSYQATGMVNITSTSVLLNDNIKSNPVGQILDSLMFHLK